MHAISLGIRPKIKWTNKVSIKFEWSFNICCKL